MTKIQMTAPRPRRIEGLSRMDMAIIAYFAAHPDQQIPRVRLEWHLAEKGFKRPHMAGASLDALADKGYLKPLPFAVYQFRCAA